MMKKSVRFIALVIVFKLQINFSLRKYFAEVILPIIRTSSIVVSAPVILHYSFSKSIITSVGIMAFTFVWSVIIVFYAGLNKNEKQMIVNKLPFPLRKIVSSSMFSEKRR